jgi:ADP-heptose:LPS heptosyltransferase
VWDVLYPHTSIQERENQLRKAFSRLTRRIGERALALGFTFTIFVARAIGRLPKPPANPSRAILVIHLTPNVGDAVLLMPLLEQLHRSHPELPLELAIGRGGAAFFEHLPWLNRVYAMPTPKRFATLFGSTSLRKIVNLTRFYKESLAHVSAEICLLPRWNNDQFRALYLAYLLDNKRRIGWRSNSAYYNDGLLTERYSGGSGLHEAARFCLLAESAGLISAAQDTSIVSAPIDSLLKLAEMTPWNPLSTRIGLNPAHPFAVIAPGASEESRRWPVERWTDVIAWLRSHGLNIVIVSGPSDAEVARKLHDLDNNRSTLLAGSLNLMELTSLIRHAGVFLGNDSGPGHVAGGVGTPTVILFASSPQCPPDAPSNPNRIRPLGPRVIVCQPHRSIAPCNGHCSRDEAHCIEELPAEDVLAALSTLLQKHSGGQLTQKGGPEEIPGSALFHSTT